jgi:hypothetical protein
MSEAGSGGSSVEQYLPRTALPQQMYPRSEYKFWSQVLWKRENYSYKLVICAYKHTELPVKNFL